MRIWFGVGELHGSDHYVYAAWIVIVGTEHKIDGRYQNWINFNTIFGEGQLIQEMRDINLISIHHIPNTFLLMRLFFAIIVYLDYKITYVRPFFLALYICWMDLSPSLRGNSENKS